MREIAPLANTVQPRLSGLVGTIQMSQDNRGCTVSPFYSKLVVYALSPMKYRTLSDSN